MRVVFVGRDRRIPKRILMATVTLGVSRRVWTQRVLKEVDGHDALGLNHRMHAIALAAPYVALPVALTLALTVSPWLWLLIAPPLLASGWVTLTLARATKAMLAARGPVGDEKVPRYGPAALWWALTWLPLLGGMGFIAWTQDRLNRFWAVERRHPERGVELDETIDDDPAFLVELGEALAASSRPGSRFEGGPQARVKAWVRDLADHQRRVRDERLAVRAAGGTTPVMPWKRPQRMPRRMLHVTCGRCAQAFDVVRDPLAETPVLCPKCGLMEILPSLRDDELRREADRARVPVLEVDCPKCRRSFHAIRHLATATELTCPHCGRSEVLPPGPPPVQARRTANS